MKACKQTGRPASVFRTLLVCLVVALLSACSNPPVPSSLKAVLPKATSIQVSGSSPEPFSSAPPGAPPVPAATLPPPQISVMPFTPSPAISLATTPVGQAALRQLTQGGCCVQPFWSPDSQRVLYIDKPEPNAPAGVWGIPVEGGPASLWSERLGIYSSDLSLRAFPSQGQTVIEPVSQGQTSQPRWVIANGGRAVSFSPDNRQIAWTSGQSGPPFDRAVRKVWVSQVDGSQARQVFEGRAGGFVGWLADDRLLVTGRPPAPDERQIVWALTLPAEPGQPADLQEVIQGERLRSLSISPNGSWLAYVVSFNPDPNEDGLWLVSPSGGQPHKVDRFGAFRWRDGSHLLLVPADRAGQAVHQLLEIDAPSGAITPVTDPAHTPFKIANGDWSVSPDGQYVVFVSAQDQNLWLIELP